MSSPIVTPEDVLETLMNDGTIDAIRLKIINQLKSNEELKNSTIAMVEQSKVLNTPGAEKQTKRELFDALRGELETPVLEKASKLVWEVILDNYGLGKEISETVEKVYCRLCGKEPTFFLPNADETQKDIKNEKGNEEEKPIESEDQRKKSESSSSSLRKRTFSDLNMDGMGDIANGNADSTGSDNSALRLSCDQK